MMRSRLISFSLLVDHLRHVHPDWSAEQLDECAHHWVAHQQRLQREEANAQRRFYYKLTVTPDIQKTCTHAAMRESDMRRHAFRLEKLSTR